MGIVRSRSGGVGILATLILMFSIVMFVSTLFWLITDAGFLWGAPGSSLFKPATVPDDTPRTLNQTIVTLQQSGCMVVYYTEEYKGGYERVSYEVFLEAAVDVRVVYRVDNLENGTVLLVEKQGKTLKWVPES